MKISTGIYFLTTLAAVQAMLQSGLRARFDVSVSGIGTTYFFDIPKTISDAEEHCWIEKERPYGPMEELVLYCYEDCVFCALYDDNGYMAGVQVAIPAENFTKALYNWEVQGFTNWTTDVNGIATKFFTNSVYFVSEETLAKSKEERLASRLANDQTLYEGFVLTTGINRELMYINSNASAMTANQTIFTKQGCMDGMGRHYFYNMSSTTECTATAMYPWFVMVHEGQTVAVGLSTYGQLPIETGKRNWFERPTSSSIKQTVPDGPPCGHDSTENHGSLTLHIYFVDEPWLISCDGSQD